MVIARRKGNPRSHRLHELQTAIPELPEAKPKLKPPRQPAEPAFLPQMPTTVSATGLSHAFIEELCLKHLFQAGALRGTELVHRVRLAAAIVEEIMERLRRNKFIEISGSSGTGIGRSSMVFPTQMGHEYVARCWSATNTACRRLCRFATTSSRWRPKPFGETASKGRSGTLVHDLVLKSGCSTISDQP
jgi:DNA-binding MarR family transcriptional regulator